MGLLDRIRARRTTEAANESPRLQPPAVAQAARFATLPHNGFVRVVGESFYQPTLTRLRQQCVRGVEGRPCFRAHLVRAPENPYDEHAIAVHCDLGPIGHLPRDTALRYGATFAALRRAGFEGAECTGILNGGLPGKEYYGVTLCIDYPEDCEETLGLRDSGGELTTGRVHGRHHTTYVQRVKELRRDGQEQTAQALLLQLLTAAEEEAMTRDEGVASWYYEQLAISYRKLGDFTSEIAVLERYSCLPHRTEAGAARLA